MIGSCTHSRYRAIPTPPHIRVRPSSGCESRWWSSPWGGGRESRPVVGDLSIDSVECCVSCRPGHDARARHKLGIQTDGGEESYIVCHRSSSAAMNSTSLDCSSLATVRSLGGAELEYDLWEGQFTFSQPGLQHDHSSVVHFFKSEYHALVNKVTRGGERDKKKTINFTKLKKKINCCLNYLRLVLTGSNTPATDYRPGRHAVQQR